ncbi:M20 family metallopeptidase [Halorarius litoreus]|uniref:M20 family metallopeptidase n=1 Tax=Halorarius litoreus TaxID=2962676 RepID=UPI0020CDEC2A|nr:M20/M25/M40 family metallo-hydrolase [Halorarius litoreus]
MRALPDPLVRAIPDAEGVADLTLDLLAADSQNPPGDTREAMARVETELDALGLDTERFAIDPKKPNVQATLAGETDRVLCFNGHLDTVTYDADAWSRDPLGERDGDRVYGRGATDMKGPVAAMLAAARAYVESDTTPPVTLRFAFVSDEETGGSAGVGALVQADRIAADACVIGETTCSQGRHSITVADRGSIWLTLEATGRSAHGSRPMLGVNAIDRLYDAVETIRVDFGGQRLDVDPALESVIDESADYYAPTLGADTTRELFAYPSINLGTIEGGEGVNTVPASARARLDVRLTAGVDTREVLADIHACARSCEGIEVVDVSWSRGSFEPLDSPLVAATTVAAEAVTGDRVYRRSATGGGDAKKLRHAGIPTVEFALGTDTVHAVDEYTTLDALAGNARAYTRLPYDYAAAAGSQ